MELLEAMRARHAVRKYLERPVAPEAAEELRRCVDACNRESGLHLQLVLDEPEAFDGLLARCGGFRGVRNYLAVAGEKGGDLEEACGYYGQQVALRAQQLGLNTCWVAASWRRVPGAFQVGRGEKVPCVIALGYGATQGVPHRSRPMETLCRADGEMPDWFRSGMEAAMLAPTARNQQKFRFVLKDGAVSAEAGSGLFTRLDLGIAKYQFELGAGLPRLSLRPGP